LADAGIDKHLANTARKLAAERRIGELMAGQRDAGLMNEGGGNHRVSKKPGTNPTHSDGGIYKNLADTARKLAAERQIG